MTVKIVHSAFGHWKKKKLRGFFNTIVQFTNARNIHSAFYQWRMIDDNQKMFIPHMAIDIDFFHSVCKSLYDVKVTTKGAVRAVRALLRICPLSAQWPITVWDGAIALKGSHSMGDGRIFLKTPLQRFL